ncbi:MAG: histidinol phosphatase [Lentisphaerae bacterium]|jgi:predicted metal-dependent phosphoesterase TrpH|nr:histidinol phosphatase [Lentisphaerota bacterium]
MKTYKYETHLHTRESSPCGGSTAEDYVEQYKKLGYTGIIVTDHLYYLTGDFPATENLDWAGRVNLLCEGFELANKRGQAIGLDVFLGWEGGSGWMHLLTYGLDKDWLLAHPDLPKWSPVEYCNKVRESGGMIIHAHPFREGVDLVQLLPFHVDAIESINGGRRDEFNRYAHDYAVSFDFPVTAGTDIHSVKSQRRCGVESKKRFKSVNDYMGAVKERKLKLFDEIVELPA